MKTATRKVTSPRLPLLTFVRWDGRDPVLSTKDGKEFFVRNAYGRDEDRKWIEIPHGEVDPRFKGRLDKAFHAWRSSL